jgi:hypothetical protein
LDVVGRAFKRQHFGYQRNNGISSFRKIQWHRFRRATKSAHQTLGPSKNPCFWKGLCRRSESRLGAHFDRCCGLHEWLL